jgi:hypothetical protein
VFVTEGEEARLARDRKGEIARLGEIERVALCLLFCIFLSTKGAYYGANKQS